MTRSYFSCVGWTLALTFLCGFAFVFAYAFTVWMIAMGYTNPPLPDIWREQIAQWLLGIPQGASKERDTGRIVREGPEAVGGGGESGSEGRGGGGGSGFVGRGKRRRRRPNYDIEEVMRRIHFEITEEFPLPTMVDLYELETFRGRTRISGLDFYWWYSVLWNNKDGWWWEKFGYDEDGFTIWDAMVVIMYYEAQFQWDNPYLPEAMIRKAHSYCSYMYGHPCESEEDFINWFAAHNQSAGNHVLDPKFPTADYTLSPQELAGLKALAASFLNHPPEWQDGCTGSAYAMTRPCGWANLSYYNPKSRAKIASNPEYLYTMWGRGDPWIIPSGCVWAWWGGGVRLELDAKCPVIRP